MVKLYVKRIMAGVMTIEDVPELWREKVRKEMEGMTTASVG